MKKNSTEYLGKGIIISLILMVEDLIGGFAHLRFETWFKWLFAVIVIVGLIIFCIQYGKEKNDGVTYGKVFGFGIKITSIVALLMVIYTLISLYFIFPELKDQVLEKTRTDMEAKGGYSEDMIDKAVDMTKKFFLPFAVIGTIIGTFIFGTIGSLLGAAFAKKSEPVPDVFQDNP
jgi:uncharacterized membrane protein